MNLTMIGVGNLMEVIWPIISRVVGGDHDGRDVADRLVGVTADEDDIPRKEALFGFPMVLNNNLSALRRNHPDLIMFSPPPTVAPELIETVLRPYYDERRAEGGPLPELYAFPPVPQGQAYLDALGDDVLVVNMIPNNVTSIGGRPVIDEGHYAVTYAAPWPADRVTALQDLFAGQGAYVELDPHQIVPMLGGLCVIGSLWHALPIVADQLRIDHNDMGEYLRARVRELSGFEPAQSTLVRYDLELPNAAFLTSMAGAWHIGISRYYAETDIAADAARTFVERHLDLVLHTVQVERRSVLDDLAVGAATKGGVLERAIGCVQDELLPALAAGDATDWDEITSLVVAAAHNVREHGQTLAG
jgi:hypothetical protein